MTLTSKLSKLAGYFPFENFFHRFINSNIGILAMPDGIVPVSLLLDKSSLNRSKRLGISEGSDPSRPLFF